MPKNPVRRSEHIGTFSNSLLSDVTNLHGYIAEAHNVVTPDGYTLTLHRIPGRVETKRRNKNRTIILHHGLLGSSVDWILLGPNHSLAYLLNDAGYDVWLANARGNKYSKTHVTKSVYSSEYWDFSWHEIGLYDLSSIIDYVKENTLVKSQIYFVAHSMGAAALTVLLSTSPQYNTILNLVILLAPLVFMQQAKGPFRIISELQSLDYNATLKILGENQFIPSEKFIKALTRKFCKGDIKLCENPLLLLSDGGKVISDSTRMKNILAHVPAGGSTKTIMHFGQLISSGRFEMFDGGSTMNIKKYGIASPPKYHLREIKLPVALFSSHDDWLSTVPDIIKFLSYIPNPVVHHIVQKTSKEFSHFDFVWGEEAPELVYKHIFDILKQY
ncbi:unnamed protein product [Parnassius apollo]|uniref:Lipase n=1 Tax=Parnassius apollo TaxID=110799 RepID=A0A8S3VXQ8_PARAO|nr:unnamed protein product [Parnassius apollo]